MRRGPKWSREGRPSTMYAASVKGAPAKPIRGRGPSSATVAATASRITSRAASSRTGSAATSSAVRTAWPSTGPTPGWISTSTPARRRGTTMSEKKIAASTSWRRTGCIVISRTRSGMRQESSIPIPSRTWRYSGSERPACRMNHTGWRSGRWPRSARRSGLATVERDGSSVRSGCSAGSAGTAAGVSGVWDRADMPPSVPPVVSRWHIRVLRERRHTGRRRPGQVRLPGRAGRSGLDLARCDCLLSRRLPP